MAHDDVMVLIHLRGALEKVRFVGEMSSWVVKMMAWHLSGLTLRPTTRYRYILFSKYMLCVFVISKLLAPSLI